MSSRAGRMWELTATFVVLPPVIGMLVPPSAWLVALWCVALAATWRVSRSDLEAPNQTFPSREGDRSRVLRSILLRFAVLALLLGLGLRLVAPDRLFRFPGEDPERWILLCLLYPVVSVYPQELLYRAWFLRRYSALFRGRTGWILVSGLCFAWMHVVFQNGVAMLLSLVGGCLFADTYLRSRSLLLVCLEHSLYGLLVLLIGLGDFLWHGRIA